MTTDDAHFDTFTRDDWWEPGGKLYSLHKINPLRFEYFCEKLAMKGKTVLDVGCGGGVLSESFASAEALVTGIDLSSSAVAIAKDHARESGLRIDYRTMALEKLVSEKVDLFDAIVLSEVLEHTEDLEGFIKDAAKLVKTGGMVFFSTFNKTLKARLLAITMAEDLLGMVPRGTHDFSRFIRPSRLTSLFRENDITVEEIRGMSINPLTMKFRLSSDTSVNYLGFGVKG